jgi:hypothetical protein
LETNTLESESTAKWIQDLKIETHQECPHCSSDLTCPVVFNEAPKILIFEYPDMNIRTSPTVVVTAMDRSQTVLHLRGIVYHGGFHFTSQIITKDKDVWYHDGQQTGQRCAYHGKLEDMPDNQLRHCKQRNLVLAVYAQDL